MGDPCGIGAEIIIKALADESLRSRARFVIFGLAEQIAYTADALEIDLPFRREHHEDLRPLPDDIVVLDYDELAPPAVLPRGPSRFGGKASMAFCQDAIAAAKARLIDALVTAPISKTSWREAGFSKYPGHTELLAEQFKVKHVAMMFVAPQLRVVLATIHEALFEIRNRFTIGCVFHPIDLADQALRQWFGLAHPRIAVAGLNPHAGEDGRFGDEENRVITPAIIMAAEAGIRVSGPYPGRHGLPQGPGRGVRLRGGHVPRPGADPHQAAGLARGGEPDAGPADHPHQPRPRDRLRHRGQEQGRPLQHDRRDPPGHRPGQQDRRRAAGVTHPHCPSRPQGETAMPDAPLPAFKPCRPLGKTGFVATILGIGDLADPAVPLEPCVATVRRAMDAGLNVIDTAPCLREGLQREDRRGRSKGPARGDVRHRQDRPPRPARRPAGERAA